MNYRYDYERTGGPMSWKHGPPNQSRAADARGLGAIAVPSKTRVSRQSLGSLSEPTLGMPLPAPGAPEPLDGYNSPRSGPPGPFGCGNCPGATGDFVPSTGAMIAGAAALAYLLFKKKKRK